MTSPRRRGDEARRFPLKVMTDHLAKICSKKICADQDSIGDVCTSEIRFRAIHEG
jgi:hypothetical protein